VAMIRSNEDFLKNYFPSALEEQRLIELEELAKKDSKKYAEYLAEKTLNNFRKDLEPDENSNL
jgi:hypothetical protein